ncbi:MAG TPA: DUF294 nucleotidyltransferase-like domain-containing protein [Alcanivoracaceae bacterium]|nr:DUF294 nucleotidyltransferase-like domain-containing protein [Alcanivoracaceae bacterium]
MTVELIEIRQHLEQFAPFRHLSEKQLDEVAASVEVSYFQAGTDILVYGQDVTYLHYIRSGAVEVYRYNGELYNRLSEGDIFGETGLLRQGKIRLPATAIEDSLIYFIPAAIFFKLCDEDEEFADFVELQGARLQAAMDKHYYEHDLILTRIRSLVTHRPLMVMETDSIQSVAQRMNDKNVTSALVLKKSEKARKTFHDDQGAPWQIAGIVTDKDFRTRVAAEGVAISEPVSTVVTPGLISVQTDASVYEAMLTMLRNNLQHLAVLNKRQPVGLLNLSDIVRFETQSSLYLVDNIYNQTTVEGLAALKEQVSVAFVHMVTKGDSSQMIGSALSIIARSFAQRLLELGEEKLGPPPVPYCFMSLGSMARHEQSLLTDQDNALVLDDSFDPALHDDYFLQLATFVSDGLDACGYPYCDGHVMATNIKWRQPLAVWEQYFRQWIERPTPKRLLHSGIFFDMDPIHGEESLVESLQKTVTEEARRRGRFLAAMAKNAVSRTPPLGFFRTFVMEKDGKENRSINLKHRGTAPLVDLIRVHALACGSTSVNSFDRIADIAVGGQLSEKACERLHHALEFIAMVRIRQHAADLKAGNELGNRVEPERISRSEKQGLKEAFQYLSSAQKALVVRYPGANTSRIPT